MASPEGVVAIVGGSRGTGAELARQLLESEEHYVVVGYADPQKEVRARQVAGFVDPVKRKVELDPPRYGDRAMVTQIDVTDPTSRFRFAVGAANFAREHNTSVTTLALLGASGIGQTVRRAFDVNQEGQIYTARTFWEMVGDVSDPIAMTLFAQSFQGHTVLHPDSSARVEFPDDYAPVALSKSGGEVGLRLLNNEFNDSREDNDAKATRRSSSRSYG
jgi:NAD(P)-dependent dehydrogenase (short-subunit alcohol dehydrogenase family)